MQLYCLFYYFNIHPKCQPAVFRRNTKSLEFFAYKLQRIFAVIIIPFAIRIGPDLYTMLPTMLNTSIIRLAGLPIGQCHTLAILMPHKNTLMSKITSSDPEAVRTVINRRPEKVPYFFDFVCGVEYGQSTTHSSALGIGVEPGAFVEINEKWH